MTFLSSLRPVVRLVALGALLLVVSTGSVAAQSCGDTLYASTTLTHDLVGCPGVGLFIGASDVTLDLNGHQIVGAAGNIGISVFPGTNDIAVVGPGTVTGFRTGFWTRDNERLIVRGVSFLDNGVAGIECAEMIDSEIDGNLVLGSTWGITLYGSGAPADDNRIVNNQVAECQPGGHGIEIETGARHDLRSNYVKGCDTGILLNGTSDSLVKGNAVIDNTTGILVVSGYEGPMERNVVAGNKVYDNVAGIVISSGAAAMFPVDETFVEGNAIQGGTWGIDVEDALCIGTHLVENQLWWQADPLTDFGTATVSTNNTCNGLPC